MLAQLAEDYALEVPPDAQVGELPVGLQQRVEILKALFRGAEILILDEPTGALTPQEAGHLFRILRRLAEEGKTIILITHKLREVMEVTDRISVMREGAMVAHRDTTDTTIPELAELMVGRRVLLRIEKGEAGPGRDLLAVEDLSVHDERGTRRVREVSFAVREGEIVGIAGVAGNGQSELLEALAGLRPVSGGRILLGGRPLGEGSVVRRREGLAHVPEDRRRMGLVLPFEARESAILGYHDDPGYRSAGRLDWVSISRDAEKKMKAFDVRPVDPRRITATLSGGNQQKLVLAREIERDPLVLVVGQPTRGVDIGAIEFIHRRLVALRDAGKAVLLVSSELDEIMGLSDRILVMFGGAVVGELPAERGDRAGPRSGDGWRRRAKRDPPRVVSTIATGPAAGLPRWAVLGLLPLLNLLAAFAVSGLVVLLIGEDPWHVVRILLWGAFGFEEAIGYTLFYATNFIFTGLAVAVAFHCGLFNIGGEGQAYIGGLGVALVCLHFDFLPFALIVPAAVVGAALFGGAWAFVPALLQAYRGSHVVITTIMFNFIAAALMVYLLVNVMSEPGSMQPETRLSHRTHASPSCMTSSPCSGSRSPLRRSTSPSSGRCSAQPSCGSSSGTPGPATACGRWASVRPRHSTEASLPPVRSWSRCSSPVRSPGS